MKKVLIVEDEASLLLSLADNLSKEGFDIIKAENGEKGLALALEEKPDLILLDILLPKMDGLTMLKKLRQDEWGKDAEVIILTNLSDNRSVSDAMEQGSYDYLIKTDWKMGDVIAKVHEKLKE
jgi:two-component system, OmpR family, alkaline phosphatase synthesis response regulator PhoP